MRNYKALILDKDGTVIDSNLDFDQMRKDLGMKEGSPILEHLKELYGTPAFDKSMEIVDRHEMEGAQNSTIMRDFLDFYQALKRLKVPMFIHTRNSQKVTNLTLRKHELKFDKIVTRDDALPKPNTQGVDMILEEFNFSREDVLFIGDTIHDLETARNAKMDFGLIKWSYNTDLESRSQICFENYHEISKYFIV